MTEPTESKTSTEDDAWQPKAAATAASLAAQRTAFRDQLARERSAGNLDNATYEAAPGASGIYRPPPRH